MCVLISVILILFQHPPHSVNASGWLDKGFGAEVMPMVMRHGLRVRLSVNLAVLNEYGYAVSRSWVEKKKKAEKKELRLAGVGGTVVE